MGQNRRSACPLRAPALVEGQMQTSEKACRKVRQCSGKKEAEQGDGGCGEGVPRGPSVVK